jgi:TonB family protein
MRLLPTLLAAIVTIAQASAQTPTAMEHYRAYRAALERGDLAAAENEAEQGLAIAEANGDPRTAVFALNLATTRITRGDRAGALAPARRALSLAQAGADGVDPTFAEVVVGRAELANSGQAGADRLSRIILNDAASALAVDEVYPAAAELGHWLLLNRQPDLAAEAWSVAGANASGSLFGEAYGRGNARTWEAASIIIDEVGYRSGRHRINAVRAQQAYALLTEAYLALRPLSQQEAPGLELTVAQQAFAQTMAWRSALHAKLVADGQHIPPQPPEAQGDADGNAELGPVDLTAPRCLVNMISRPAPQYPAAELEDAQLGVVVLRLRLDADGEVLSHQVAARAGSEGFVRPVERVADRWRFERREDSPPNCRMPQSLLVPVSFMIG